MTSIELTNFPGPDLLRQGVKTNHSPHIHPHQHDHHQGGLQTTAFLTGRSNSGGEGGGNMTLPRYSDSSKTNQVVRNNGTSTPPNNCNYNFQYSPTNPIPHPHNSASALIGQASRGSSGTGSPSDSSIMHFHHPRINTVSHPNFG